MDTETVRRLDALFASHPVLVASPVPRAEVDDAERVLGVVFPSAYREFIERYGGGIVGHLPIHGVRSAETMGSETVMELTARFRAQGWSGTAEWIVISVDLGGNPVGLDREGRVWISDHDGDGVRLLAQGFEDFLLELVSRA